MNEGILGQLKVQYGALNKRMKRIVWSGIAALFYLVIDTAIIQPLMEEYSEVTKQIEQAKAETKQLGMNLLNLEDQTGISSSLSIEEQIEKHKGLLQELDFEIAKSASQFVSPTDMARFVERILAETQNVQLVSLTKQPVQLIAKKKLEAQVLEKVEAEPVKDGKYDIYRHGISFSVKGRYPDLLRYLEKLESLPWQVNWEGATLTTIEYPYSELSLNIYTLSLDSTWLRI